MDPDPSDKGWEEGGGEGGGHPPREISGRLDLKIKKHFSVLSENKVVGGGGRGDPGPSLDPPLIK